MCTSCSASSPCPPHARNNDEGSCCLRNDARGCSIEELDRNDAKFFKSLEAEVKSVNR